MGVEAAKVLTYSSNQSLQPRRVSFFKIDGHLNFGCLNSWIIDPTNGIFQNSPKNASFSFTQKYFFENFLIKKIAACFKIIIIYFFGQNLLFNLETHPHSKTRILKPQHVVTQLDFLVPNVFTLIQDTIFQHSPAFCHHSTVEITYPRVSWSLCLKKFIVFFPTKNWKMFGLFC